MMPAKKLSNDESQEVNVVISRKKVFRRVDKLFIKKKKVNCDLWHKSKQKICFTECQHQRRQNFG